MNYGFLLLLLIMETSLLVSIFSHAACEFFREFRVPLGILRLRS